MSVLVKAFDGSVNNRNNCITKRAELVGCLEGITEKFVFSASLSPMAVTTGLTKVRILRGRVSEMAGLRCGMGCFYARLKGCNVGMGSRATVVPIVVNSRRGTLAISGCLRRGKCFVSTVHCPAITGKTTELEITLVSDRARTRLGGYTRLVKGTLLVGWGCIGALKIGGRPGATECKGSLCLTIFLLEGS